MSVIPLKVAGASLVLWLLPWTGSAAPATPRLLPARSNLFAVHDWQPPAKVAPPVEIPRAPPLPFVYEGKWLQGSDITVFVSYGGGSRALKQGDVVGPYRVDNVGLSAMTVTYTPLNQKQILSFGSAN